MPDDVVIWVRADDFSNLSPHSTYHYYLLSQSIEFGEIRVYYAINTRGNAHDSRGRSRIGNTVASGAKKKKEKVRTPYFLAHLKLLYSFGAQIVSHEQAAALCSWWQGWSLVPFKFNLKLFLYPRHGSSFSFNNWRARSGRIHADHMAGLSELCLRIFVIQVMNIKWKLSTEFRMLSSVYSINHL